MSSEAGSTAAVAAPDTMVEGCKGGAIGVHRGTWTHLPLDVATMVAPPVMVTATPREDRPSPRRMRRYVRP